METNDRHAIESLVSALCDGVIEPQQLERLEQMLRESAQCRRIYLQYIDMHARLTVHPNLTSGIPVEADTDRLTASRRRRRTWDSDDAFGLPLNEYDDPVLELARASLEQVADEAGRVRKRRQTVALVRWASLAVVVLVAVFGWRFYDQRQQNGKKPAIREVVGEATIEDSDGLSVARADTRLRHGQRLRTGNDGARAVLEYADGTKVAVYFNSLVEVPSGSSDVQLRLLSGAIEVDAVPQAPDRPLIFATDHARYVVLGTRLRLYREANSTRLELDEGKVRLERQVDGKTVLVTAGQMAIATAEPTPLDVQPLAAGRSRLKATLQDAGHAVAFSPDSNVLATSDWQQGLKTWTLAKTTPQHTYPAEVGRSGGLAFAGEMLAQVSSDERHGVVTLWRPGETEANTVSLPGKNVRSRALSPDGLYVAESDNDGTDVYGLDVATGGSKRLAEVPAKGKAWCLSLSPSAQYLAAGFWDGTVRVSEKVGRIENPSYSIVFEKRLTHTPTHIALSGDGDCLAVFTKKDGLLLIDLESGRQRLLWSAGAADVTCLKITSDGRHLMTGLSDGTVRLWSVDDGRPLIVIDTGHVARDIAWEEEEAVLATADGEVKLWECEIR